MLLPETLKLHRDTFEFHYIYFLPWKNQVVEELQKAGGKVTCFQAGNNLGIALRVNAVVQYCKDHEIQVIHSHLPWAGLVSRLVRKRIAIPVIYTEHNKQERYHFATRWMNKLTFDWQTAAVAVSQDVSVSIRKNIGPSIPVHEVANGVNTDLFERDATAGLQVRKHLGIPETALVVGTVSVFRFQKRLKEWMEIFRRANSAHSNLYGIIVGDGPLRTELEQHRIALGLEDRIFMPGLQVNVKPWYSAMDVFMMASVFEGLPIALLEAMSMGCAIVTTDAGGVKQVIRNGVDGMMVAVDDWESLSTKVIEVMRDDDTRQALAVAARRRVESAFGLKGMVQELEKLYLHYASPRLMTTMK